MSATGAGAEQDSRWMARALELAWLGRYTAAPNPAVGCVLVQSGQCVGEGWHRRAGEPHAEVHALRQAGASARGATAYVTLEPCAHHGRTPPCSEALIRAGVARVVVAIADPNPAVSGQGIAALREAGIWVEVGVGEQGATEINRGFLHRMESGRPWVRLKLAMSLDGRTALAGGESRWITGEPARADVHCYRARSDVILTGIGTVLADDPALTARLPGQTVTPLRVVLDSRLRTPPTAAVVSGPGAVLVMHALTRPGNAAVAHRLCAAGCELQAVSGDDAGVDLAQVFAELARRECNEVLVECGATLAGALLDGGWVDELLVYLAPRLLGNDARPLAVLPAPGKVADAMVLQLVDVASFDQDVRLRYWPRRTDGRER